MNVRHSVHLLTVSVFAILMLLALVAGYTLSNSSAPVAPGSSGPVATAAAPDPFAAGKKVWRANSCGTCHAKSMTVDLTGPALRGVTARWADYPREDLYAWIRNSGKLIAEGHPRANKLFSKWKTSMNTYPALTDEEIEAVLKYIEGD